MSECEPPLIGNCDLPAAVDGGDGDGDDDDPLALPPNARHIHCQRVSHGQ